MLTPLLKDKPWSQDWPESVQKEFNPTLLTDSTGGLTGSVARIKPVMLALRQEVPYSRLKIVELLKQLEEWSEKADHFQYPPTLQGWNRQFQELCVVSSLKGRQQHYLPYFIASCYPKAALEALKEFNYDNEFISSLKNALSEWALGQGFSVVDKNSSMESPSTPAPSSNPSTESKPTDAKPTPVYQKPQYLEKFQKWAEYLSTGEWDNATKRDWLDSKLKFLVKQTNTFSEEKWFSQYAFPALAALSEPELETWMDYWPNRKIPLNQPLEMLSAPRFWGIMKSAPDEVRDVLFEKVLPSMLRFGSVSQKEKYEVGQEMLKKTSNRPDEFVKRVQFWQALGGDLDAVLPSENNPNQNLFSGGSEPETLRSWIASQGHDAWTEGLKQLTSPKSLKM